MKTPKAQLGKGLPAIGVGRTTNRFKRQIYKLLEKNEYVVDDMRISTLIRSLKPVWEQRKQDGKRMSRQEKAEHVVAHYPNQYTTAAEYLTDSEDEK